jgi:hypothetical protein
MPPESSFGYEFSNPSRPTVSRIFNALFRRGIDGVPVALSGTSTFSNTVSHGKSAKLWKTIETFGLAPAIGSPRQSTLPAEGFESPVRIRRSVDFPEPEGPNSATISPAFMARSVGAITKIGSPCGCGYDFST